MNWYRKAQSQLTWEAGEEDFTADTAKYNGYLLTRRYVKDDDGDRYFHLTEIEVHDPQGNKVGDYSVLAKKEKKLLSQILEWIDLGAPPVMVAQDLQDNINEESLIESLLERGTESPLETLSP